MASVMLDWVLAKSANHCVAPSLEVIVTSAPPELMVIVASKVKVVPASNANVEPAVVSVTLLNVVVPEIVWLPAPKVTVPL